VELEGRVLVLRRVHVVLELRLPPEQRETAERVHGIFADACPCYRSLRAAIAITTELRLLAP
jgi:organic hydroperoxide reductase OsmC/OhrA